MYKIKPVLFSILLLFTVSIGYGQKVIELDKKDFYYIGPEYFRVIKDCHSELKYFEIDQAPSLENIYQASYDCQGYWLEFSVANQTTSDKTWYLEVTDPHIDTVTFFGKSGIIGKSGFKIPFNKRYFEHKNHRFPIKLKAGEKKTFYLKLNPHYDISFSFVIISEKQHLAYALNEYWILGMYYGIILIMAIYNFFIYFSVREKVYLYYVMYAISCGLMSFTEDGLGFQYLWPHAPQLNQIVELFTPVLLLSSFILYANSFLQIRKRTRINYKIILYSCILYFILFTIHQLGWVEDKVKSFFLLIPFSVVYLSAIKVYYKGYTPARFFLIGYSFIIISLAVFIFRIYGIAPTNLLTIYCFNIGFILEVVVLSFALGERLRIEKKEKEEGQRKVVNQLRENQKLKDSINKQLEIKITERTLELKESNEELGKAKKEIESAYAKLREQAKEIASMNIQLNADNKVLQVNVKELNKARVMFKEVNFEEFSKIYPDDESCLKYLSGIKWKKGYKCRKCKNTNYSEGRAPFSRRCTKCGYEESVTAFTIFHRNRLPITKAFYMVFLVSTHKKDISSEELSRKLDLRQKSCWTFKQKIVQAIKDSSTKKFSPENWGNLFLNTSN